MHNKKYITKEGVKAFSTWIAWKDVERIEYSSNEGSSNAISFNIYSAAAKVSIPIRALYQDEITTFFNSLPQLKFVEPTDWRFEFGEWVKK